MIWHEFADAPVGFIPADGRGLNPLLMNPWMVIHPPTLFLGYVSAEIVFGFVVAGLLTKDFVNWYKAGWSWILYGTAILGIGIILGGYWAYATLGWGGFWGWDPVENASFVPWMVFAALIHGIIIQHNRGALVKTNLFLGGLLLILVLYGSFLTRSGVLTDFSVHSFGESELNVYWTLFLFTYIGAFLILFFRYFKEMKGEKMSSEVFTREAFVVYGMLVLLLSGILTFIGMSFPLFSSLVGQPTNVPLSYYNILHIPIGFLIAILGAVAPLLAWNQPVVSRMKVLIGSTIASVIITIVGIVFGMKDIRSILLFWSAMLFLITNGVVLFEVAGKNVKKIGAYVTHLGIALMLLGIVSSSFYSTHDKFNLPRGEVVETPFGLKLTFEGKQIEPDGRDRMKIRIVEGNSEWVAKPRFFFSQYNQAYMASPDIDYQLTGDIYIAPIQYIPASQSTSKQLIFNEGKEQRYADYKIKFMGFETNNHAGDGMMRVATIFEITYMQDGYEKKEVVKPLLTMDQSGMKKLPAQFADLKFEIGQINANDKAVSLIIYDNRNKGVAQDILSIEVSRKPFISLMWIGTVLLGIGMLVALINRLRFRLES